MKTNFKQAYYVRPRIDLHDFRCPIVIYHWF